MTTTIPYIPPLAISLKNLEFPQIRLGLQGASGTGKTWAALTFPNPLVLDFDNGLTAHKGKDIFKIPFHDPRFITEIMKMSLKKPYDPPNRRDALKKWLREEGPKLQSNQTLILDSWSTMQDGFDQQTELEPSYTKLGAIDDFAFWELKIEYSRDITEMLMGLNCHVVVTFHEISQRDIKTGQLLEKIQPLMQGKFLSKLKIPFTDFFRQHAIGKLGVDKQPMIINGRKLEQDIEYFWQIKGDNTIDCKTRMTRKEILIPAHFNSFTY